MKIIKAPELIDFYQFESFIYNNEKANFFQSKIAYHFFEEIDNYDPFMIALQDEGRILGSLMAIVIREGNGLKGYMSRRCIVWGGPVLLNDGENVVNTLLHELNTFTKKNTIYTEFRNFTDYSAYRNVFYKNGFEFVEHFNYIVPVKDAEQARAALSRSKKRQINKSIKNGAHINEAETLAQVEEFYKILKILYKEKVKKPLPSFDFFKTFFEDKELGKYFLISYNGNIIGGIMCPIYKDTIYEWYVCGLDSQIDNVYPSVLATWAPIEYAAKNGLKYFDFMGAGKPDQDYGVREFKSKFGGELVNYGRFVKINKPFLYKIGEIGVKMLGMIKR